MHSLGFGHLDCFHLLAANAAVNTGVQISVQITALGSFGYTLRGGSGESSGSCKF